MQQPAGVCVQYHSFLRLILARNISIAYSITAKLNKPSDCAKENTTIIGTKGNNIGCEQNQKQQQQKLCLADLTSKSKSVRMQCRRLRKCKH